VALVVLDSRERHPRANGELAPIVGEARKALHAAEVDQERRALDAAHQFGAQGRWPDQYLRAQL